MGKEVSKNSSKEVVINVAQQLFAARGYASVTLKDIADRLGIKQASLYYHFPGGKEDLFMEVTIRHLEQQRQGLEQIIAKMSSLELEECLNQVAKWLLAQPPLHISRLINSDLPALPKEKADQIQSVMDSSIVPAIAELFARYQHNLRAEPFYVAATFLAVIEPIHIFKHYSPNGEDLMIAKSINLFLHGAMEK
ncbi:TetR/AcrR family transcriptional regulator [Pelatocladus sp. BLCC-F211]|uniref:TetR/AcrR family transcriptional regulator n=1 Tax=Pelatocladus sp. BLCC-F211 TaxID=3342752 RepID=UPI0035B6B281